MNRPAFLPIICCVDAIAQGLAYIHHERLRYVAEWKRWMLWDGTRWRADDSLLVPGLARDLCRKMVNVARREMAPPDADLAERRLGGARAIAEVERLARTDQLLAAPPGQFDAEPDLVNTQAGILDTRSGALSPHRADAWMTRITAVAPAAPGTPCPLWSAWLDRVTCGDAALLFFLQRVAGRALVVRDTERKSAAAGRSLFVATLARILGDDEVASSIRDGLEPTMLGEAMVNAAPDPDLADGLAGEYPAILRWAVDGCLAWRRIGLAPPASARRTRPHLPGAFDQAIDRFLDDGADASPASWESAGDLYARWQEFAAASGEAAGSPRRFGQAVAARGFAPARRHGGRRGFAGIRLRRPGADYASPSVTAKEGTHEAARPADVTTFPPHPTPAKQVLRCAQDSLSLRIPLPPLRGWRGEALKPSPATAGEGGAHRSWRWEGEGRLAMAGIRPTPQRPAPASPHAWR